MYTPPDFNFNDLKEMIAFINQFTFGLLITSSDGLKATHIPLNYDETSQTITGHISKANAQLNNWVNGQDVLVVFQGPHAYVSSGWYHHDNVPTWNYVAVHVYGELEVWQDESKIKQALIDLVNHYEKGEKKPLNVIEIDHLINKEIRGITFFEIKNLRFEGAKKLSQNRNKEDHQSIVNHLTNKNESNAQDIAKLMQEKNN